MSTPHGEPHDDVSRREPGRPAPERPEYGEYATPQEQAAAIARSLPAGTRPPSVPPAEASPAETPSGTGRFDAGRSGGARPGAAGTGAADGRSSAASAGQASVRPAAGRVDRFVTILLLALGLVYLLEGVPSFLSFADALQTVFTQWGIGDYTPTPATRPVGIAILVVQAVLWSATTVLALLRLRRGRSSWWVALLGAVVSFVATAILFAMVLTADPAFTTYLTSV